MYRDDYLLRHLEAIADAIARIAGLSRRDDPSQIATILDEAWRELLDAPRALLDAMDAPTLAGLLRGADQVRAAAQLSDEEAHLRAAQGDAAAAARLHRRARELEAWARAREAPAGAITPR